MNTDLVFEHIVKKALKEDLGQGSDVTGDILIPTEKTAKAAITAREPGVLCGLDVALKAFSILDPDFKFDIHARDGDLLQGGETIVHIEGSARAMFTAERTALNFLTHLSGIASMTLSLVDATKGTDAKITCTRKTIPGLRALQKYAVRTGGGRNHRFGLGDAILIKDNHIAVAGGISQALDLARKSAGHTIKIEIEVDTLEQLEEVMKNGKADIVMLDNFMPETLKKAVDLVGGRIVTEASGRVDLSNIRAIAKTGVDYISVGALTHSAPALDIGLDIET